MTIKQNLWDSSKRFFNDAETVELHNAQTGWSVTPRGFNVDETRLSRDLASKVRFHFIEKTPRIGRGAAF